MRKGWNIIYLSIGKASGQFYDDIINIFKTENRLLLMYLAKDWTKAKFN